MTAKERRANCPNRREHTIEPGGYLSWHEWADRKARRHYQVRCPGCQLFAIWKRKPAWMPDDVTWADNDDAADVVGTRRVVRTP